MVELRWPDGKVACPQCGSQRVTYLEKARLWKCYGGHPLAKFSLKTGTIFEDSPSTAKQRIAGSPSVGRAIQRFFPSCTCGRSPILKRRKSVLSQLAKPHRRR